MNKGEGRSALAFILWLLGKFLALSKRRDLLSLRRQLHRSYLQTFSSATAALPLENAKIRFIDSGGLVELNRSLMITGKKSPQDFLSRSTRAFDIQWSLLINENARTGFASALVCLTRVEVPAHSALTNEDAPSRPCVQDSLALI